MKAPLLLLTTAAVFGLQSYTHAASIAGMDFEEGAGAGVLNDLNVGDGISVIQQSNIGGGTGFNCCDGGAQTDRTSFIGRLNVPSDIAQPSVGDAAPADGVQFSISVPAGISLDLTNVSWQASQATGSQANRWVAFKTSLNSTLIHSQINSFRTTLDDISIPLSGAPYENLTNTTIDFQWYGSGSGTGDSDFDNILIEGTVTVIPEPSTIALFGLCGLGLLVRRRR